MWQTEVHDWLTNGDGERLRAESVEGREMKKEAEKLFFSL